jgi:hypothetical protein
MSIEENKKLVRRLCEEVLDQGNVDCIDELVAPDTSFFGLDELKDFKRFSLRTVSPSPMLASI